jgi:hypothetical protein
MKVITPDQGFSSFLKIFKEVQGLKHKVIVWQLGEGGRRTVGETLFISYSGDTKTINILPTPEVLNPTLPLYFFIEASEVIFKAKIESMGMKFVAVSFPNEIRTLDDSEESITFRKNHLKTNWVTKAATSSVDRYSDHVRVKSMKERSSRDQDFLNSKFDPVNLDEEDKLYADKRESPRVRPKGEKLVKVVRKGETQLHIMKLFDLSRGGMGFLTFTPDHFPKGSEIYVTGFDAFELDDPLIGTVMAHRAVDDTNVEYKIGVKFNEGQE